MMDIIAMPWFWVAYILSGLSFSIFVYTRMAKAGLNIDDGTTNFVFCIMTVLFLVPFHPIFIFFGIFIAIAKKLAKRK